MGALSNEAVQPPSPPPPPPSSSTSPSFPSLHQPLHQLQPLHQPPPLPETSETLPNENKDKNGKECDNEHDNTVERMEAVSSDASKKDAPSSPQTTTPTKSTTTTKTSTTKTTHSSPKSVNTQLLMTLALYDPPKWGWSASGGISDVLPPMERARRTESKLHFLNRPKHSKPPSQQPQQSQPSQQPQPSQQSQPQKRNKKDGAMTWTTDHSNHNQTSNKKEKESNATTESESELELESELESELKSKLKSESKLELELYAYHRGRVGQELRHDKTGELLCDVDISHTNHYWDPPTKIPIEIKFPLCDPDPPIHHLNNQCNNHNNQYNSHHSSTGSTSSSKDTKMERGSTAGTATSDENTNTNANANINANTNTNTNAKDVKDDWSSSNTTTTTTMITSMSILNPSIQNKDVTLSSTPLSPPPLHTPSACASASASTLNHTNVNTNNSNNNNNSNTLPKNNPMEYFHQVMEWDLQNIHTPEPMEFAAQMAEEYGLNYGQTLDLAQSIQDQIDAFLQKSVYKPALTITDPFGTPRPLEYSCSSSSGKEKSGNANNSANTPKSHWKTHKNSQNNNSMTKTNTSSNSSGKLPNSTKPKERVFNKGRGHTFTSRPQDREEVLRRSVSEFRIKYRQIHNVNPDTTTTTTTTTTPNSNPCYPILVYDRFCHICHGKKDVGVAFCCGINNHVYCDYHCKHRLHFTCQDVLDQKCTFDYCPCCTLTCPCSKCARRLDKVADEFRYRCEQHHQHPNICVYDALAVCTGARKVEFPILRENSGGRGVKRERALHKDTSMTTTTTLNQMSSHKRRSVDKPSKSSLSSSSKQQQQQHQQSQSKWQHNIVKPKNIFKVPVSVLPYEVCEGHDINPAHLNDYNIVFGPHGSIDMTTPHPNYSNENEEEEAGPDPNVNHCIVCNKGGNLICCDKCPRSYHAKCLPHPREQSQFPDNWICHNCILDYEIQPDDTIHDYQIQTQSSLQSLIPAFSFYNDGDHLSMMQTPNLRTIGKMHTMITLLIQSEFGYQFQEPVDKSANPDYSAVVKKPMDLGTIAKKLINGAYLDDKYKQHLHSHSHSHSHSHPTTHNDHNSNPNNNSNQNSSVEILEHIIFKVLCDIELVWHNCFIYNTDGSLCHRMGKLLRQKYLKYRQCSIDGDISDSTLQKVQKVVQDHEQKRKEYFLKYGVKAEAVNLMEDDNNNDNHYQNPAVNDVYIHIFKVPYSRGGTGRNVAVFDPDTRRVVKLYTTLKATVEALQYLNQYYPHEGRGGGGGWDKMSHFNCRQMVKKCTENPTLRCFGYRWLYFQDLKDGNIVKFETNSEEGGSNIGGGDLSLTEEGMQLAQSIPDVNVSFLDLENSSNDNFYVERFGNNENSTIYNSITEAYQCIASEMSSKASKSKSKSSKSKKIMSAQEFEKRLLECLEQEYVTIPPYKYRRIIRTDRSEYTMPSSSHNNNNNRKSAPQQQDYILPRAGRVLFAGDDNNNNHTSYFRDDLMMKGRVPEHTLIIKKDLISGANLLYFQTFERAYQDWKHSRLSAYRFVDGIEDSVENFKRYYLQGDGNVDGMIWVLNNSKVSSATHPSNRPPPPQQQQQQQQQQQVQPQQRTSPVPSQVPPQPFPSTTSTRNTPYVPAVTEMTYNTSQSFQTSMNPTVKSSHEYTLLKSLDLEMIGNGPIEASLLDDADLFDDDDDDDDDDNNVQRSKRKLDSIIGHTGDKKITSSDLERVLKANLYHNDYSQVSVKLGNIDYKNNDGEPILDTTTKTTTPTTGDTKITSSDFERVLKANLYHKDYSQVSAKLRNIDYKGSSSNNNNNNDDDDEPILDTTTKTTTTTPSSSDLLFGESADDDSSSAIIPVIPPLSSSVMSTSSDSEIVAISVDTITVVQTFSSMQAASQHVQMSCSILEQKIRDGELINGLRFVHASQKDDVLKRMQDIVVKAYLL